MHAELPRFAGSEQHALDHKGRLIVPARFRERLRPAVSSSRSPTPIRASPSIRCATWVEFCGRLEAVPAKDEALPPIRPLPLCAHRRGRRATPKDAS